MKSKSVLLAFLVLAVILLGQTEAARTTNRRKVSLRTRIRKYLQQNPDDVDGCEEQFNDSPLCESINDELNNDDGLGEVNTGQTAPPATATVRVQSKGAVSLFIAGNAADRTVSLNGAGSNVWQRITVTDNVDPTQRVFALVLASNPNLALAARVSAVTLLVDFVLKEFLPTDATQTWRFVPIETGSQFGYLNSRGGTVNTVVLNNVNLVAKNNVLTSLSNAAALTTVFTDANLVPDGFAWQFTDGTLPVAVPPVVQPPVVQPPVVIQPPETTRVPGISSSQLQRAVKYIRRNGPSACTDRFSSRVCKLARRLAGNQNRRRNNRNN